MVVLSIIITIMIMIMIISIVNDHLSYQEDERRGSGSVVVPVSRGTLVQGEGGRVIQT